MNPGTLVRIAAVIFVLFSLLLSAQVRGQTAVSIPDTVIVPESRVLLNLQAELPNIAIGSVRILLDYNPQLIAIHDVRGGGENLLRCPQPSFSLFGEDEPVATIEITCDNVMTGSGILCVLELEGLRGGPDSTGELSVKAVFLDGQEVVGGSYRNGFIEVTGERLNFRVIESLAQNAPNPFSRYTTFTYFLSRDDTEVRFAVFTSGGKLVYEDFAVGQKGENPWVFDPFVLDLNLSQGVYLLLMETPTGVFTIPFQILR